MSETAQPRRGSTKFLLAAAVVAAALGPGAASASAGWLPRVALGPAISGPDQLDAAQVVGPDGWTTVVYRDPADSRMKLVRIRPNGKFGSPISVSSSPVGDGDSQPSLAVDSKGRGVVAFRGWYVDGMRIRLRRFAGLAGRFRLAALPADGVPFGPDASGNEGSIANQTPTVSIAPDGTATLAWVRGFAQPTVHLARVTEEGAVTDLGASLCHGDSPECVGPRSFTATTGVSTLVWTERLAGQDAYSYRYRQLDAVGALAGAASTELAAADKSLTGLSVAANASGSLAAAWQSCDLVSFANCRTMARRVDAAGVAGETLLAGDIAAELRSDPTVAIGSNGDAVVSWIGNFRQVNPAPIPLYRRISRTGSLVGAAATGVFDGFALINRVAASVDAAGAATFLVGRSTTDIAAVTLGLDGSEKANTNFSAGTGSFFDTDPGHVPPLVAASSDGTITATWLYTAAAGSRRLVSQVRSLRPALGALDFPQKPRRGRSSAQVRLKSSKYATAVVTIAATGHQRFRRRVTSQAVAPGIATVRFSTRRLVRGRYRVTVQLIDYAGLAATRTANFSVR